MNRGGAVRLVEGGENDDFLKGTRRDDVIYGYDGDDTIVGGRGVDLLYGGTGLDIFVFNDRHAGDVSFGRADAIGDFTSEDAIDLSRTEVLYFAGYDVISPERGGFSIWEARGNAYVTWNTFGEFHDVELTGFGGDIFNLLEQIQWYDDDHAGSVASDASVEPGGTVSGVIEVDTDQDWFRVELVEGQLYSFDLQGEADGGGTLQDPYLVLYDEFGGFVAEGFEALDYATTAPGTYFIAAQSFGGTGTYTLTADAEPYVDDFSDNVNTAGAIAPGEIVTGVIGTPFDQDWFRVELEEGQFYSFDLQGEAEGGGTLQDPYLVLYDAFGGYVTEGFEVLDVAANVPGTYFLSAEGFGGTGSYTLSAAAEPYADDFSGNLNTSGEIAPGGTVTGSIDAPFDQDWFRIELEEGQFYSFDLQGEAEGGGTLQDPYLVLYDAFGGYVTEGFEALDVAANVPGTYFLSAEAFGGTGSYTLTAAAEPYADDFSGNLTTSGEIAPGETVSGNIDVPFDQDWFRIELEEGQLYSFDLQGEAEGGGTLQDPYLVLYDEFGGYVTEGFEALDIAGNVPGTYFLSADSFGGTGSYTLTAAAEPYVDDFSGNVNTSVEITPGETVTGRIEVPLDQDWFRVVLEEGETYTIDLRGEPSDADSLPDPILTLLDEGGQELAFNDDTDGLNSQIIYTAESTGSYFISAGGFDSNIGIYDLSVSDPGSDLLF